LGAKIYNGIYKKMGTIFRIGAFSILIVFAMLSTGVACGDFPHPGFDDPEMARFTGLTYNPNYGFSVVIPKGLVGHNAAPPAPYHGFGIVLSWEPRSYLYVDGSYNSLDLESLEKVATQNLEWLKEESKKIISVKHSKAKLGSLQAKRYIAIHTCPKASDNFIDDYTFAFSKGKGIIYTVALLTTADRYKKDKRILEEILKTWKLQPIK
jgi:hypothetical protein